MRSMIEARSEHWANAIPDPLSRGTVDMGRRIYALGERHSKPSSASKSATFFSGDSGPRGINTRNSIRMSP